VIPTRSQNTALSHKNNRVKSIGKSQDIFAKASTPMYTLEVKYEKANIDAIINTLTHLTSHQQ
jgi:phosphopentomutase